MAAYGSRECKDKIQRSVLTEPSMTSLVESRGAQRPHKQKDPTFQKRSLGYSGLEDSHVPTFWLLLYVDSKVPKY